MPPRLRWKRSLTVRRPPSRKKRSTLRLAGDMAALRLCLDRILPPRKDRPITFDFPAITTAAEAAATMSAILAAVAGGEITPAEASEIAKLVEAMSAPLRQRNWPLASNASKG